jgi:hypothetical protein
VLIYRLRDAGSVDLVPGVGFIGDVASSQHPFVTNNSGGSNVRHWLNRLAGIVVGAVLLIGTSGHEGTILGFYPPNDTELVGRDAATLAIDALALSALYRGFVPKQKRPPDPVV